MLCRHTGQLPSSRARIVLGRAGPEGPIPTRQAIGRVSQDVSNYAKGGKGGKGKRGRDDERRRRPPQQPQPPAASEPLQQPEPPVASEAPQEPQPIVASESTSMVSQEVQEEGEEKRQVILTEDTPATFEEDEDSEDDYDPAFVADQKRLREEIDPERPYAREKPRNWDFITGLPVPRKIKIAKVFPYADEATRKRYRAQFPNDFEYMAQRIREMFSSKDADKEELRKWYIANRDWLGQAMRIILPAKSLKYVYEKRMDEAQKWHDAFATYRLVESSVTCHLHQVMREAEIRLSQNLGNLNMIIVGGKNSAERAGMWLILKSVLAKWEARREQYLAMEDRTIVQERALGGTRKVVELFQKMNMAFSECEPVMQSLPVEIRYLDTALAIRSGTELRRWTLKDFCLREGLSIEELRERVRALYHILEDLAHDEFETLHNKIVDIYRAIALGTAEFETEDSLDIVFRDLPASISDPDAPYPFKLEPRLDAGGAVNRTVALSTGDKLDVYLKNAGVPFPESTKLRLEPRAQGDDLWWDRWALLWGKKPEDWYALPTVPPSQQLAGTFNQDFIDRMQRNITRRRTAGPDGTAENPIYTMQYEYLDKSPEERAAWEKEFEARPFEPPPFTYWDVDGETILTEEQVKEKYLDKDPNWKPPPLPPPKQWLDQMRARSAKWEKERLEAKAAATAATAALEGMAQAAAQLKEATKAAEDKGTRA